MDELSNFKSKKKPNTRVKKVKNFDYKNRLILRILRCRPKEELSQMMQIFDDCLLLYLLKNFFF